ncbi:hypothetical protein FOZ63_015721, partial [Perkinsus olseni]
LPRDGLSAGFASEATRETCIAMWFTATYSHNRPTTPFTSDEAADSLVVAGITIEECLQTLKQHNLSFAHGMNVSVLSSELSSPLPQQGPPSPSSKSNYRRASAGSRMSFVRSSTREALSVRDVAGGSWGENDGISPVSEEASVAVPNASAPMSPESEAPGEGPPEG